MNGRTLHLDRGLGWTKPQVVACCAVCGTELARHRSAGRALRAASRRRCPGCGVRAAGRLPGTTSLSTDLALAWGGGEFASRRRTPDHHPAAQPRRVGRR